MQTLSWGIWDLVSWPGIKPRPPCIGRSVLAPGPPGKSPILLLLPRIYWIPLLSTLIHCHSCSPHCLTDDTAFSNHLICLCSHYSIFLKEWERHFKVQVEKAMTPHSSTLAWKTPWMEEPSGLQSMESLRVGHDWAMSLSLFTFMHWRRKRQLTPVFLPGESQGCGEPGGLPSMGSHRSDTTEAT